MLPLQPVETAYLTRLWQAKRVQYELDIHTNVFYSLISRNFAYKFEMGKSIKHNEN